MTDLSAAFVAFFAVIDPIGTVPVFVAVTASLGEAEKRAIAFRATVVSAMILIFFVLAGELILDAIAVPLSAFQIAGGIVLFLFALSMIFGESKPEQEVKLVASGHEKAIFPLAVPSIASPGAMLAAVMQTENESYTIWEQAQVAVVMLSVLLLAMLLMLASSYVHRLIGSSGASVISRVMGLILASVAVTSVLSGIEAYFSL